jgi:dolichol kinase
MRYELHRQFVHISGIIFIALAQAIGQLIAAYFLFVAATLFFYSLHIRREHKRMNALLKLESRLRDAVLKLERHDVPFPFTGAIWFYFTCGMCFLAFPLHIASAVTLVMAAGDGLATIAGTRFGKHKTVGSKTEEGTLAFFLGGLTSAIFLSPLVAVFAAGMGALLEMAPGIKALDDCKKKGILDDNFLVPVVLGLVLTLIL